MLRLKHIGLIFTSIFILMSANELCSADSSFVNNLFGQMDFDFKGGILYCPGVWGAPVLRPDYFDRTAKQVGIKLANNVSDNPLAHGAGYFDLGISLKTFGFTIKSNLIAEDRGQSYGVYNQNAMKVIPKYYFAYDTNISIMGNKLYAGVNTGNYDDLRMYEGLTIYNIDVQGTYFYVKWNQFKAWYRKIAALDFGPGLNIDDLTSIGFSAEGFNIWQDIKLDFNYGMDNYRAEELPIVNYSAAFYNENFRLYSQFGYRNSEIPVETKWSSAFLAGLKYKYADTNFRFTGTAEYRYYGYYFNKNFVNKHAEYRQRNIYPLYLYDRPFSQWAVFTEYQNLNTAAYIVQLNGDYFFYDKFNVFADIDANYIQASFEDSFLYLFVTAGVRYEPIDKCYVMFSMTNKAMNLDKPYPAFYFMHDFLPLISLMFEF